MSLATMARQSAWYDNHPKSKVDANTNGFQALIRDDNRSINGDFDVGVANPTGYVTLTNAAHIIPFRLNSNQDNPTKACLPFPTVVRLASNCYANVLV